MVRIICSQKDRTFAFNTEEFFEGLLDILYTKEGLVTIKIPDEYDEKKLEISGDSFLLDNEVYKLPEPCTKEPSRVSDYYLFPEELEKDDHPWKGSLTEFEKYSKGHDENTFKELKKKKNTDDIYYRGFYDLNDNGSLVYYNLDEDDVDKSFKYSKIKIPDADEKVVAISNGYPAFLLDSSFVALPRTNHFRMIPSNDEYANIYHHIPCQFIRYGDFGRIVGVYRNYPETLLLLNDKQELCSINIVEKTAKLIATGVLGYSNLSMRVD